MLKGEQLIIVAGKSPIPTVEGRRGHFSKNTTSSWAAFHPITSFLFNKCVGWKLTLQKNIHYSYGKATDSNTLLHFHHSCNRMWFCGEKEPLEGNLWISWYPSSRKGLHGLVKKKGLSSTVPRFAKVVLGSKGHLAVTWPLTSHFSLPEKKPRWSL